MAEIKSTLDLIMEKTKHLSLNDEEKRALEQQELRRRVQAPVILYLKGERDADFLARELNLLQPEKRERGIGICLDLFLEGLSPFKDNARILAGAERLLGEPEHKRWEETVVSLTKRYREEWAKIQEESAGRFRETLAAVGLQGSALLPCVGEPGPSSKEEEEEKTRDFRKEVKKALANPCD